MTLLNLVSLPILGGAPPGPLAVVASFDLRWLTRFAVAFIPAFLSTGVLLGMLYVLATRAIKANRRVIEEWFERQRLRLLSGPVPVIEWAQPLMVWALYAIYGRDMPRRLATSIVIGLVSGGVILSVLFYEYRHVPPAVRATKIRLEREADQLLFKYATTPALARTYKMAFETHVISTPEVDIDAYTFTGGIYDQIRHAHDDYEPRLLALVFTHPDRLPLTLLYLFEGNCINPGFRWFQSLLLLGFNVVLDFVSITIVIEALRWLGRRLSFGRAVFALLAAAAGTVLCFVLAVLSYSVFLRGNTRFFVQVLLELPFSLGFLAVAICLLIAVAYLIMQKPGALAVLAGLLVGGWLIFLSGAFGVAAMQDIWTFWRTIPTAAIAWRDLLHVPYSLAATTLVPATLSMLAFGLMVLAKTTAEPARVVPEIYMTFVKEEVGGTQASGIILILGTVAGVIAGLIWGT
jgi:hypothetical protein